jgi:hypothetical protein
LRRSTRALSRYGSITALNLWPTAKIPASDPKAARK